MKQTFLRLVTAMVVILQLAGCGGGGAGATGATPVAPGEPAMSMSMVDSATQVATTAVSVGNSAEVSVTVLDSDKQPVSGALVSFQVGDATLATLKPSSGTALTDVNGLAKVRVDAASIGSAGATTVSASASVDSVTVNSTTGSATTTSTTVTAKLNFSVGAANVTLSGMSANLPAGTTRLSPYATTSVTISIGGVPATTAVAIDFSSTCANAGKASLTPTVNSTNGIATATYADLGCGATDTISASVAGTSITTTIPLSVDRPSAAAIQFVSAVPATIVLKGTGGTGLLENSTVTFKLMDNNNQPIANQDIELSLTTRSGGIALNGTTSGSITRRTDALGNVTALVSSGSTPTAVWVVASHTTPGGLTYTTQSGALLISTGRPAQDRFSLSIETFNIEGLYTDGITTKASVIASDRVGNPVPDGTAINFISSGGQIGTASVGACSTVKGACGVVFTSASPRPATGRIAITAYALGEESFVDANSNNAYDPGESFTDLGEAFVDNDFSGSWSLGEQAVSFASNSSACPAPSSIWTPSKAGTCDGVWGSAHVRQSNVIVLSGRQLSITSGLTTPAPGSNCQPISVDFYAFDENGNPLPAGTDLSVADLPEVGWSATIASAKVPSTAASGGSRHSATFTPAAGKCDTAPAFITRIKAKTPAGYESASVATISVQGSPPPPVVVVPVITVPGAPTIGTATAGAAGSKSVTVTFAPPSSTGGAAITSYTATCTGSGTSFGTVTTAVPITVTGLINPGNVTCTVVAYNSVGGGAASAASNSVAVP